jgi:hypothetical protein
VSNKTLGRTVPSAWRFVRLSHNRRYLHYADFDDKTETEPRLDALEEKSECDHGPLMATWPASTPWLTCMNS